MIIRKNRGGCNAGRYSEEIIGEIRDETDERIEVK
jgi:hypothetical protein